ncbi:MurR/RpiR family transcriptional regulator [Deinococcus peraridilitoris]|uniref:Transcriptional regulator n=1 Tax=Deinococcus peraridilitoris (strain DSM 19664 / LMG 22246 / CIP 109416 / KR-200) TaxID=937777 RepID=L0A6T0_DEIPD|nr:MurR/RpiR family transcriptional regulator [Deinococcus peraridilitoris]AFZ69546.1 transcriptional regulator [Deinococcus peraridilitoris DSM 19664]
MTIVDQPSSERAVAFPGILALLRHRLHSLNSSAQKTAEMILADPALTASETLTELAERAGVSESSIVRFVRQQGFKRFQEFKVALAFDAAQEAIQQNPTAPSGEQPHPLQHLLHSSIRSLEQTYAYLDPSHLGVIAEELMRADQILVIGAGASGALALEFQYKLVRLGLRINATSDMHLAAMQASLLNSNSAAIAISRSGATIDTLRALEFARQQGATTIVVTSKPKSSAAQGARHVLLAAGAESPIEGGALTSELSTLFILNALHTTLLDRLPHARSTLLKTAQAISDKRE